MSPPAAAGNTTPVGSVTLLSGSDPALLSEAVSKAVAAAVGDAAADEVVTRFIGEEFSPTEVAAAAATPPFLTEFRVVVARELNRFGSAQLAPLVDYLAEPLPTTSLVLEWGSGRVAPKLAAAVKQAGGVATTVSPPRGRERRGWLEGQFAARQLHPTPGAVFEVDRHLGDDLSRVAGLLDTLLSTYGAGSRIDEPDVAGYLGVGGDLPPWEVTDAIDRGDARQALTALGRMWTAGRAPQQVMSFLTTHYCRALRLHGAGIRTRDQAATALGVKSPFMANKALELANRLNYDGLTRVVRLLATADQDIRGRTGLADEAVIEVLVARLCSISRGKR